MSDEKYWEKVKYYEKLGINREEAFNDWKLIHLDNMVYWLKLYKQTNDEQYHDKYRREKEYFDKIKNRFLTMKC